MKNETKQCGVYVKRRETRRVQKELHKTDAAEEEENSYDNRTDGISKETDSKA